jgi:hypothetical protein
MRMINLNIFKSAYRDDFPLSVIGHRAVGKLIAKALHNPRIDKREFHRLHWRHLRRNGYVRSQGHPHYFKAAIKPGLCLFDLTPEDLG